MNNKEYFLEFKKKYLNNNIVFIKIKLNQAKKALFKVL